MNLQTSYDRFSQILHWVMAVIIIYATIAGYVMHLVINSNKELFYTLSIMNMSLATVGTILFIVRWLWSYFRPAVKAVKHNNMTEANIAHFMHALLYFLMFIVFISGYLMLERPYQFFWLFSIDNMVEELVINQFFFMVHRVGCIALACSVIIHIIAACYHHYVRKNNLFDRMTKSNKSLKAI